MTLSDQYQALEPYLQQARSRLETFLQEHIPPNTHIDRIAARAKSRERFLEKACKQEGGKPKYDNPLSDIQDLLAARVVVLYLHEVKLLSDYFSSLFMMIERVEKEPDGFSEFGYIGWHGIVRVPEEVKPDDAPNDFPRFFEVQVKTIFQHAWAEAEHDLAYKQFSGDLTRNDKRMIAYAAAQAWGADNAFAVVLSELQRRGAGSGE